jgi:prevent-host-death family protein
MKIASVAEIKSHLSAYLKASEGGPVVVTRNGRAVAVIVGVQDEDEIERLLMAYSPRLRDILEPLATAVSRGALVERRGILVRIRAGPIGKGSPQAKKKEGSLKLDLGVRNRVP